MASLPAEGSVVVLGAGVIGLSTAYYLSNSSHPPAHIYVLDSSPVLFRCASGRAAGFLAKDWFHSSLLPLGELSFRLHKELADKFDGRRHWGYSRTVALSLNENIDTEQERRGEDWLFDGQSRGIMSHDTFSHASDHPWPKWLKKGDGHVLSTTDTTAQIDPKRFCEFLLHQCKERNVTVLYPATATSVATDDETGLPVSLTYTTAEPSEYTIPCTSLLLAAGPWTGRVYDRLFPKSQLKLPISNLAGWSVVFRDPAPSSIPASCYAVFTTSASEGFSPEVFGRMLPFTPQGEATRAPDGGRDIYLAGLNSSDISLPNNATEVETAPELHDPHIVSLLRVAERIFSLAPAANNLTVAATKESNTLEVLRTGLCHRPVTSNGRPILTQIGIRHYAPHMASRADEAAFDSGTKDDQKGGLYVCAGHGPWGISLSLGSGKVCADLILGQAETAVYLSESNL